mgnify:CR=1 FL=1
MKVERIGEADVRRIVDDSGKVLAFCYRYTSGFWAVHDATTDRKMCEARHSTPTKAMRWFETLPQHPDNKGDRG